MTENSITNPPELNPDEENRALSGRGSVLPRGTKILDAISLAGGKSTQGTLLTANYYGFNHNNSLTPASPNQAHSGMTFFTRPQLNLSNDNLIKDRIFTNLAVGDELSVNAAIRSMLDPLGSKKPRERGGHRCPIIDTANPFISLLSNNLVSLSGWSDPFMDMNVTTAGRYNEQQAMADGFSRLYGNGQLTATFKNVARDPIGLMFYYWVIYQGLVHEGVLDPYFHFLISNELDSNTRIFRFILDPTKTYIEKCASTITSVATTSLGDAFNYSKDEKVIAPWNDVSVTFQCNGFEYMDPIILEEFNSTVLMYNRRMAPGVRDKYFTKVRKVDKAELNYLGYPWVNLETAELEWWIDKEDYASIKRFAL